MSACLNLSFDPSCSPSKAPGTLKRRREERLVRLLRNMLAVKRPFSSRRLTRFVDRAQELSELNPFQGCHIALAGLPLVKKDHPSQRIALSLLYFDYYDGQKNVTADITLCRLVELVRIAADTVCPPRGCWSPLGDRFNRAVLGCLDRVAETNGPSFAANRANCYIEALQEKAPLRNNLMKLAQTYLGNCCETH